MLIVSNGATVFADGTISFGRAASFNTGVVCGAGSQLISSANGGVVIGITAGNANFLQVYNGGYINCGGAEFSVDDGTGQFNGFQMGGTGAMSTGFAIQVRNNSNSTNTTITVSNAVFTCSEMEIEGNSNTLSVLANGTLIFSNAVAIASNTNAINDVLRIAGLAGPEVATINAGTVNAVSGTNAFQVTVSGGTITGSGNSIIVTNAGKLLSELFEIGRDSSYNTGVVSGVGSVWSNWTSQIAGEPTNYIHVGDAATITSSYNYLAIQNGASLYNNGELSIGSTNTAPYNTVVLGGAGAPSTIVNSGNVEVGVDGQTYGNTLIVTNASLNCGSLSVGGTGATSNFLEMAAATITVNGPMYVAPTNTANFSSGVLSVGSMAFDATANNGNGFVVGDGADAAVYAMNADDTGFHYFGGGLVITNGATLEGNGTLVGNVTVLGTFAPGFGVGTVYASNNLTFGSSAVLDYDLGTSSDSVTVNSNLTLAGTLNINNSGGFASGNTYLLFTYNGTLTYNGLSIGSTPIAGPTYTISTNTPGQVNLVVTGGSSNPFTTWQLQYFGSTSCALCGGNASYTGDGMSNTNKFLAGFNPTNSAAYLHVVTIAKTNNNTDVRVTYLGANGDSTSPLDILSRTNVLEFTTGTANGSYTNNFLPTGQTNVLSGGTGLGVVTNMVDSGGATNKPSRYYRVRVLLP
jgi:fibronectin-binding autotransporter adhesin